MPPNLALPVLPMWTQAPNSPDFEARAAVLAATLTRNGYLDVSAFAGATASDKAIAALASIDATGVFAGMSVCLDFRRLTGVQVLDRCIYDVGVNAYARPRISWLWGSAEYRCTEFQRYATDNVHIFDAALFIMKDLAGTRVLAKSCFVPKTPTCLSAVNTGSAVITPVAGAAAVIQAYAKVGSPVGVFGNRSSTVGGGSDVTTITADPGAGGVVIAVASVVGFGASGYVRIDNELVRYTGVAGNTFTGCVRGYGGSTAAAHAIAAVVERVTYDAYYITAIDGATGAWTLDRTLDNTATTLDTLLGTVDCVFTGAAILDGNMDPAVDDAANPFGIFAYMVRRLRVSEGLTFQNWDHGGIMAQMCQDSKFLGDYQNNGRAGLALGSNFWLFTRCYRNYVRGHFQGGYQAVHIDDRTTGISLWDGPSIGNVVEILSARDMVRIADVSSCIRNTVLVHSMEGYTVGGIILERSTQWNTNVDPQQNHLEIHSFVRGAGAPPEIASTCTTDTSGNRLICRQKGAVFNNTRAGMEMEGPKGTVLLTYAAGLTIDLTQGDYFQVTVPAAGLLTLNFPTGGFNGKTFTVEVLNNSGVALTVGLTGTFKPAGAMPAQANGTKRLYTFYNNGAQNIERHRSPADIA